MKVDIYILYRSKGNPRGTGEAAAIIEYVDKKGEAHTRQQTATVKHETKNALALKICISALRTLLKPCEATIYIDCEYLSNAHRQRWPQHIRDLQGWVNNRWIWYADENATFENYDKSHRKGK